MKPKVTPDQLQAAIDAANKAADKDWGDDHTPEQELEQSFQDGYAYDEDNDVYGHNADFGNE